MSNLEQNDAQVSVENAENGTSTKEPAYLHLINLLKGKYDPFKGLDGNHYAKIRGKNGRKTIPIDSEEFNHFINSTVFHLEKKIYSKESISRFKDFIKFSCFENETSEEVFIRVGNDGRGNYYYDLGDESGDVIRIDKFGWEITNNCPINFIRKSGMIANVRPEKNGDINLLKKYVNIRDENDWVLLVTYIVQAIFTPPYPILILNGEQGSAKSTMSQIIGELIDPNYAQLNSKPRDERETYITAASCHFIPFDNLSYLTGDVSDTLCRLSTGGGFRIRQLNTDEDLKIFKAARPMLLNGINDLTTRPDLISRSIVLELPKITKDRRMSQVILEKSFKEDKPKIMGGIFNILSKALGHIEEYREFSFSRMSDFFALGMAISATHFKNLSFGSAYYENMVSANRTLIEQEPVIFSIKEMVDSWDTGRHEWIGTLTELSEILIRYLPVNQRLRAQNLAPNSLSRKLKRYAPLLEQCGVGYEQLQRESSRRLHRIFDLSYTKEECEFEGDDELLDENVDNTFSVQEIKPNDANDENDDIYDYLEEKYNQTMEDL